MSSRVLVKLKLIFKRHGCKKNQPKSTALSRPANVDIDKRLSKELIESQVLPLTLTTWTKC